MAQELHAGTCPEHMDMFCIVNASGHSCVDLSEWDAKTTEEKTEWLRDSGEAVSITVVDGVEVIKAD